MLKDENTMTNLSLDKNDVHVNAFLFLLKIYAMDTH